MVMNLLLIRHGESTNNRIAESTDYDSFMAARTSDPALTERGTQQALALARHLAESTAVEFLRPSAVNRAGYGVTRLVVSPMVRTLLTAAPTAERLGLPLEIWPDIFEQGGLFEGNPQDETLRSYPGYTRAEFETLFPGVIVPPEVTERGWWRGGYEEMEECSERAAAVAARLKKMAAEEAEDLPPVPTTLAMVTHGTFMNQLLHHLLGVPDQSSMYFFHANTGITRIEFAVDGFRVLRYVNRTQHLPAELLSR